MTERTEPFCPSRWIVDGYPHACLKRQRHDGSCWCCEDEDYPGGDLAVLEARGVAEGARVGRSPSASDESHTPDA